MNIITSLTHFIQIVLPLGTASPNYVSAKQRLQVEGSLSEGLVSTLKKSKCPMPLVVISILVGGHLNCIDGSSTSLC